MYGSIFFASFLFLGVFALIFIDLLDDYWSEVFPMFDH